MKYLSLKKMEDGRWKMEEKGKIADRELRIVNRLETVNRE
jgi:hypothetical protein